MDAAAPPQQQGEDGLAVPGDRIGRTSTHQAGAGTYVLGQHIFASALGRIEETAVAGEGGDGEAALPMLSVVNTMLMRKTEAQGQDIVLEVGHTVLGRVLRLTSKQAHVEVLAVGEQALRQACQGIIKKEDVRQHDIDRVEIYKCFRPGDIVRARVVSLGDSRQYYLSTAENELGVLYAKASGEGAGTGLSVLGGAGNGRGGVMVPVDWETMEDPVTGVREPRKVAKPVVAEGEGEEEG